MKRLKTIIFAVAISAAAIAQTENIDRKAVITRNNPIVSSTDTLGALTVGNGSFATTVDFTGLQSFPEYYSHGISLCAQSDWGWHSFPNTNKYRPEETLGKMNLGHGHDELYALQFKDKRSRQYGASEYFRINPHRLNLGTAGLYLTSSKGIRLKPKQITDIHQKLNIWEGVINSHFIASGREVDVETVCHPQKSCIAAKITSPLLKTGQAKVIFRYSYPSGGHVDDGNNWSKPNLHSTTIHEQAANHVVLKRTIDSTIYDIRISWQGNGTFKEIARHQFVLSTKDKSLAFTCEYSEMKDMTSETFADVAAKSDTHWAEYWKKSAIVDFSNCKDPRAKELERRVVLSQYLTAIQCAGNMPPQESGLTLNTWFGRPHLEMAWWHLIDFALWGHPEVVEKSLNWYNTAAYGKARDIAKRQGYNGVRWMKMTDPWAGESPSNVGSLLIWQQPHYIYMAEEMYRANPNNATLDKYGKQVDETAQMMADFVTYDNISHHYIIKGETAMQETMRHDIVYNQPFELAYWRYGLTVAQEWRVRRGLSRIEKWDDIIKNISSLPEHDGIYLAGTSLVPEDNAYQLLCRTDHPAVLAACGMLPYQPLFETRSMKNTYDWVIRNWDFSTMWGWDFGVLAMTAARLGEPAKAVDALLMNVQKNTYLPNGHNYQNDRLKLYLPGNGALLEAVAMMCAGWDGGPSIKNPGFPSNGNWDVRWDGLQKMQ